MLFLGHRVQLFSRLRVESSVSLRLNLESQRFRWSTIAFYYGRWNSVVVVSVTVWAVAAVAAVLADVVQFLVEELYLILHLDDFNNQIAILQLKNTLPRVIADGSDTVLTLRTWFVQKLDTYAIESCLRICLPFRALKTRKFCLPLRGKSLWVESLWGHVWQACLTRVSYGDSSEFLRLYLILSRVCAFHPCIMVVFDLIPHVLKFLRMGNDHTVDAVILLFYFF